MHWWGSSEKEPESHPFALVTEMTSDVSPPKQVGKREFTDAKTREMQDWTRVFQKCLVERGEARWIENGGVSWLDDAWWDQIPVGPNELCWDAAMTDMSLYDFNAMMDQVRYE